MPSLKLAANYINGSDAIFPNGGFGHLQIVLDAGIVPQELEVQSEPSSIMGTWQFRPEQDHVISDPSPDFYKAVTLDATDREVTDVWSILTQVNDQLLASGIEIAYDVYQNSNSYATTALLVVGINAIGYSDAVKPDHLQAAAIDAMPGIGVDVFRNAATSINLNIVGNVRHDYIQTGALDDHLAGGAGKDSLIGRDGADQLVGANFSSEQIAGLGVDTTRFNSEWYDGERDLLVGGDGNDQYFVFQEASSWSGVFGFHDYEGLIPTLDLIYDEDGQGTIWAQEYNSADLEYYSSEVVQYSGDFIDFGSGYGDGTWHRYYNIDKGLMLWDMGNGQVALGTSYSKNNSSAFAIIQDFNQGDFGINLEGYSSPGRPLDAGEVFIVGVSPANESGLYI